MSRIREQQASLHSILFNTLVACSGLSGRGDGVFCTPLPAVINFESQYFFIVFISDVTGHARLFFLRI